jgi:hypothetical protein
MEASTRKWLCSQCCFRSYKRKDFKDCFSRDFNQIYPHQIMKIFLLLIVLFIFTSCSNSKVSSFDAKEKVFKQDSIKYEQGYIKTH